MEKEKFNQIKYIQQYNKEHYKTFKVDLKIDIYMALENKLKDMNLTKSQFLRNAIEEILKK